MIDNTLRIMMLMWMLSGILLATQYVLADEFGIIMKSWTGEELKPHLLTFIDEDLFDDASAKIVAGTDGSWDRAEDLDMTTGFVLWELVQLLSGTYIFNVLVLLGLPSAFVTALVVGYFLLLARTIVGLMRGV